MGTPTPDVRPAELVGREPELAALTDLVGGADRALVLEGEPGIGKTCLWERGVEIAREQGHRVLVARGSSAEAGLSCGGLIDLLDGVPSDELGDLPSPQLRALEVALYRREPKGRPPEAGAIALGLLSALRALSVRGPVLVAVDDLQWLDPASEDALAYAARRLDDEPVAFLLARRPGAASALEDACPHAHRAVVGPIGLGGTRKLLSARLGVRLPHHQLRRVVDTTLGNPLFVLEVGRLLAGRDVDTLGEDLPVPDDVEELLGLRVADLDGRARRVLLALALDPDLKAAQLDDVAGAGAVSSAVREGVAVLDGDRVRAAHPLLAAAAKRRVPEEFRQALHRELAAVVPDEQRRALHLALATTTAHEGLAGRLAAAADQATSRGATRLAVELGTHALRLTPPDSADHVDRTLALGRQLAVAGEKVRLAELLDDRAASLPTPAARVTAYLLLMGGVVRDNDDLLRILGLALAEAGDDPALRAPVLAELASNQGVIQVVGLAQADEYAVEAVASAGPERPVDRRAALYALAWTRSLRGHPVEDLCEEYRALTDEHTHLARNPVRIAGQRLVWRGEVDRARELLTSLRTRAEEWAEPSSYALARLHLCELELRAGGLEEAERLLDQWGASTDSGLLLWPMYERCRALLAACAGDVEQARRWGDHARALAESTGVMWDWLEATRALGLAALLDHDLEVAVRHLSAVWDHAEREGVADPGAFPAAPDLVEALVDSGAVAQARRVYDRLDRLAREQAHPWALTGSVRSAALVDLTDGYAEGSADTLAGAAAAYDDLGLGFDAARTRLALGRVQRRARKWGAARDTLEEAAAAFDGLGCPGWAAEARAELGRVGARRPSAPGSLTETERRVADLAVAGLSNKEIARTLVVTVSTVEFHLRNVYAKLGIRSRVQLAGLELDGADDPEPGAADDQTLG